jgi:diacylglycerol kinase (ATP)
MRVDERYSLNVINFGFDTAVARTMSKVRRKKLIGGKHAYTTGIVTALFTAMKNECTVFVDGEQLNDGKMLLCTVANGKYVGGAFCCAPRSDNTDGLLEVCLVTPISRFTFVKLLTPYKKGEHLDDPGFEKHITYRRGKSVHVEAPEGFAFSLDGEIVYKNDFTIEICPAAIRFAVPAAKNAEEQPATEKEPVTV